MHQTEYLPLQNIDQVNTSAIGGFCRWWFVPIEWLASFPEIDPLTQQLTAEPVLLPERTWLGPVRVPDDKLGWTQAKVTAKPGITYKQQVEGFLPGIDENSYLNLGNLDHHQFCIIGKLRSGGMLVVIGDEISGLDLTVDTVAGQGAKDTAGHKLLFTGETIDKAPILPALYVNDPFPFLVDFDGDAIVDDDGELISAF